MAVTLNVQDDDGDVADANGYITSAYFTSYHLNRGNDHSAYSADQVKAAIVKATDYIDTRFAFKGVKMTIGVQANAVLTATGNFSPTETVTINGRVYTFAASAASGAAYTVLLGVSLDLSLANLAAAINADGTAGVEYTAGTEASGDVTAESDATTLTVTAITGGTVGNAITVSDTLGNASWDDDTLTDGTEQTTEFPRMAGSTLPIPFFDIDFLTPTVDANLQGGVTVVYLVDPNGVNIVGIPLALKRATAEYAFRALSAGLFVDARPPEVEPMPGRLIDTHSVSIGQGAVSEHVKFAPAQSSGFIMPAYPAADLLLVRAGLIVSGRQLVR